MPTRNPWPFSPAERPTLAGIITRGLKRLVTVAITLTAALAVFVAVGLPLYVFPRVDIAAKTDVIYVIGPPTPSRIALATSLIERGLSDNLMVSVPNPDDYPICTEPQSFTVYCDRPSPFTTQGEARELRDISAEQGWTSATVITFTPHVTRARVILERCYKGELLIVPDTSPLPYAKWAYQHVYQSAAFVKVAINQGC